LIKKYAHSNWQSTEAFKHAIGKYHTMFTQCHIMEIQGGELLHKVKVA